LGSDLIISKVLLEVEAAALATAQANMGTYSHCDLSTKQGTCTYTCTKPAANFVNATLGSWNLSAVLHKGEPACLHLQSNALETEWWSANLQLLLDATGNGYWYSTLKAGEGASWRQIEVTKSIAKVCADNHHYTAIEADGTACYAAANVATGNGKRNIKSKGWIQCYYATILGPQANSSYDRTGGWTAGQLEALWDGAFVQCPSAPQ
jgi:hypothetical protein